MSTDTIPEDFRWIDQAVAVAKYRVTPDAIADAIKRRHVRGDDQRVNEDDLRRYLFRSKRVGLPPMESERIPASAEGPRPRRTTTAPAAPSPPVRTPIAFTDLYPDHGQRIMLHWPDPDTPPEEREWDRAWYGRFDWSDMRWTPMDEQAAA